MRRVVIILLLGCFTSYGSSQVLTKEGSLLPQRDKEAHFPSQPQLPTAMSDSKQMFVLISEANDTYAQNLIARDTPGLPLGSEEGDFEKVAANPTTVDDAVILDAQGTFPQGKINARVFLSFSAVSCSQIRWRATFSRVTSMVSN